MGSLFVVSDLAHLVKILEEVTVQDLFAVGSVEPFDVSILVRLAGLDIADLDVVVITPVDEDLASKLRSIIATDGSGKASVILQTLENANNPLP